MIDQALIRRLSVDTPSKIVMLVVDGLGGLPDPETGLTELEAASTPNLDRLAAGGVCGLVDPVAPGITPGSAPGHIGLFGYDPLVAEVGRGVLEAVGIGFVIEPGDVAARGNFCTVDARGLVTDRRAGRISSEKGAELSGLLDGAVIDGVSIIVRPVREHRFVAVFRGTGLAPDVSDTDPQQVGVPPLPAVAQSATARRLAGVVNRWLEQAAERLADHHPANMVLLRGFSGHPRFDTFEEVYKLRAAAIAVYPMYRGLASLLGMETLQTGSTFADEVRTLRDNYRGYDFFFIHVKGADSAGEDGDFARKVSVIETVDAGLPELLSLSPEVLVVTGDHSTPSRLRSHSWHPVPVLLSAATCRPDRATAFSETACLDGGLGRLPATAVMPLAMAHAGKLAKFGA